MGGDADAAGVQGVRGGLYTEIAHEYSRGRQVPASYRSAYDGRNLTFELEGEDVISHRQGVDDGQTSIKSDWH